MRFILLAQNILSFGQRIIPGYLIFGILIVAPPMLLPQGIYSMPPMAGSDSAAHHKCGFPEILESYFSADRSFYQSLKESRLTAGQFDFVIFSPSGRFKIFYQVDGIHAIPDYDRDLNGTPDYLEFVAESFDRAWEIEIDSLGFNPPRDSSGQFRDIYPVYCRLQRDYGQTILDYEIPGLPHLNFVTYTEINTNFSFITYPGVSDPIVRDSMAIAITAAHEFNHGIHSGYRIWAENNNVLDLWFIESSATYMEEVVCPEVNDYIQYLDFYFQRTHIPIDQSSGGLDDYGKVVLEIMLGERYHPQIVRLAWEEILENRALPSLDFVLQSLQSSFSAEFSLLSAWLYFTHDRSVSGGYFPDADFFPSPRFIPAAAVQEGKTVLYTDSLRGNSFQWYFSSVEPGISLQLHLKSLGGLNANDLIATLIPFPGSEFIQFPASITYPIEIAPGQSSVPFGIVNVSKQSDYNAYAMISHPASSVISSPVTIYPQPFILSQSQQYLHFGNLPKDASISIFNSQGLHIITLEKHQVDGQIVWDLKNLNHTSIGSGVYLYFMKSATVQQQGKFVVIH